MSALRWLVLLVALGLAGLALQRLEALRGGVVSTPLTVGETPATVYRSGDAPAPVVVIAHGFAGSRQLMEGFALTLARAGYIVVSYDLLGHGRNPVPMSGDVTVIEGTTTVLMDELARVADAALALPGADGRLALLGHSMASDIVVRQAVRDSRAGAVVAVSMFSLAVTPDAPRNLLVVAGAWEGMLAAEALAALHLADAGAGYAQTVGDPGAGTGRRAVLAPDVEHVGVLYSATTLREARDWLDASFDRQSGGPVAARGGWVALLLVAVVALGWPLAGLARRWRAATPPLRLPRGAFLLAVLGPAIATPLILWPFDTRFLPVLVADYLALHFLVMGGLALVLAARGGALRVDAVGLLLALPVAGFGIVLFGGALDRHVAAFFPTPERLLLIAAIAAGAVPWMLADAVLTEAGRAPLWRVLVMRGAALGSLGLAVALDFEGLMFLVIILPVILLFYLLFGTIAGWVGRATWRPWATGVGLGLFLAWALGVTFPLFAV
ncbi:MAG: alpha/beta fold hydrolase [Rhodobacterales bacterium]|nr:alpha/beta fold hydrolase [Rhodobacterales bacterium]